MLSVSFIFCYFFYDPLLLCITDHLNGETYAAFLRDVLPAFLEDVPLAVLRDLWFQQDGAPPHHANVARIEADRLFPGRWIGRDGPVPWPWPSRCPDFTILDFFAWGFLKGIIVYETRPVNPEDLKQRIRNACNLMTPEMLQRVRREFLRRLRLCVEQGGRHIEHLF